MAYEAAVLGASGYMGAEVLRLLAAHPEIDVAVAGAASNAGAKIRELYPGLAPAYGDTRFTEIEPASLDGLDVVFCALPHGESQQRMAEIVDHADHVVDLAADFRTPATEYATWYGEEHRAPGMLDDFSFGLVELFRSEITRHRHVAAPGCYPTATALALAPALAEGVVDPTGIVVDALSGVSGRGRGLSPASLYAETNENAYAYGLVTHRHTGEMQWALGVVANASVELLFTPHLVPMTRGIVATTHAQLTNGTTTAQALAMYRDYYADEPFVHVVDDPPGTKSTLGSNTALLTVRADERTNSLLAICVLDNLVKGGSGQAVQAANVLLGLDETAGLTKVGMTP